MHHVLVPVDTDQNRALTQASFVVDSPLESGDLRVTVTHARKTTGKRLRPIDEIDAVDRVVRVLERENVPVESIGCEIPAAEGILRLIDERDIDQVVMGSHNRSAPAEFIFGSVTKEVFRHTNVPVTVVGRGIEPD